MPMWDTYIEYKTAEMLLSLAGLALLGAGFLIRGAMDAVSGVMNRRARSHWEEEVRRLETDDA